MLSSLRLKTFGSIPIIPVGPYQVDFVIKSKYKAMKLNFPHSKSFLLRYLFSKENKMHWLCKKTHFCQKTASVKTENQIGPTCHFNENNKTQIH